MIIKAELKIKITLGNNTKFDIKGQFMLKSDPGYTHTNNQGHQFVINKINTPNKERVGFFQRC